jgi:hypothetical protein
VRIVALVGLACGCGRLNFDLHALGTGADGGDGSGMSGDGPPVNMKDGAMGQPAGLVTWFKLDENGSTVAYDAIANEFGFLNGGTWVVGHLNSALSFVGTGDNVGIGAIPEIANLPQLSISAWIKPSSVAFDGQPHCVFAKVPTTTTAGWQILVGGAGNGTVGFEAYYPTSKVSRHSANNALVTSQWQHVAITWAGGTSNTGIELYINGVAVAAASTSDAVGARPDDSTIGAWINCRGSVGMAGAIDEVKIFSVLLSAQDVAGLAAM